jgi:hypothetical protein
MKDNRKKNPKEPGSTIKISPSFFSTGTGSIVKYVQRINSNESAKKEPNS